MPEPIHPLLQAIREDLAGRQKSVAYEVWPGANDAEARMSKALKGEINLPAELIEQAIVGGRGRTAAYCAQLERSDPAELRKEVLGELVRIKGQLDFAFAALEQADAAEERSRRELLRVESHQTTRRRA